MSDNIIFFFIVILYDKRTDLVLGEPRLLTSDNPLISFFTFPFLIKKIENILPRKEYFISLILALIYPSFWIFYLLLPRFYRLDTTRDVYGFFSNLNPNLLIILFFLCYFFTPLIFIGMHKIKNLKEFLWEYSKALYYGLHLNLLKNNVYFKSAEYLYKIFFVFHDVFAGNSGATWDTCKRWDTFTQKILWFLYFGKGRITFYAFVFAFVIGEIIICQGKLHFGLYVLFFSPLIVSFFTNLIAYGNTDFVFDVCISDYRNQNFLKPRYTRKFWIYMQAPEEYFGFTYKMSPRLYDAMMKTLMLEIALKKASDIFYRQHILDRAWGIRHIYIKPISDYTIPSYFKYTGKIKPWSFRLAAKYKKSHGVRWFHSTPSLKYPLPETLHPRTLSFISNNVYAILAISNHPGINYNDLQKITANKKFPSPYELYSPYDNTKIVLPKNETNFPETLESNLVIRFKLLTKHNVVVGTFKEMKSLIEYTKMEALQQRPDMISNWWDSSFVFQGCLGIDQKHKKPTLFGRNQVISRPAESYETLLEKFQNDLRQKFTINQEMRDTLRKLEKSKNDPEQHIKIWADSLHLFPDKWKPPLLLDKTFDESHLNEKALKLLRDGETYIVHVSDTLYTLEKTSHGQGSFDDLPLDYFCDSFIQKQMNEGESQESCKKWDPFEVNNG